MHESDLALALRLAGAAHGAAAPADAAAAVLGELCQHTLVAAATVTAVDPISGQSTPLASTGYQPEVLAYLQSPAFLRDDVGYQLLIARPGTRARCWRNVHVEYETTPSVTEVFAPAGYASGATARLTTSDGRYTGDLHVNSNEPDQPSATVLGALHHVAPLLATAIDITRRHTALVADLAPHVDAAVVTSSASLVPVVGRRLPTFLQQDRLRARIATWRPSGTAQESNYYCTEGSDWFTVRLVAVSVGVLVIGEPVAPPRALSIREMQVLTLLSRGATNIGIARWLGISERTVAHHVEHVLAKLGVPTRTAAAGTAVEDGLRFLPDLERAQLHSTRPPAWCGPTEAAAAQASGMSSDRAAGRAAQHPG